MIVFLTLCYAALLMLLVKSGIIKLNLFWKLSPLLWMITLFIGLFIPMQWGAPQGSANVYQYIVEIVPNVTGQVIEVPVDPLKPVREGDVLFRIDSTPYQAQVDQFRAKLADARQSADQLRAAADAAAASLSSTRQSVELAKTDQVAALAALRAAKAALKETQGQRDRAQSIVQDLEKQVSIAQVEFDRIQTLVATDAVSESEKDRTEIQLASLGSQLNTARIDVQVADDAISRAQANVDAAEAKQNFADLRLRQLTTSDIPRAQAQAREAELAATSMLGEEHALVAAARAQLEKAEFDLDQTAVRAPADGFVVGVTLRPGQRVASFPTRSWMTFVCSEQTIVGVGIPQYAMRYVKVGQPAELTLKLYPGKIFTAEVERVMDITPGGQLQASGTVAAAPMANQPQFPFAVRLKLNADQGIDATSLPGGAVGSAAIYTEKTRAAHVIRRVMIRMEAWMNYVIPW